MLIASAVQRKKTIISATRCESSNELDRGSDVGGDFLIVVLGHRRKNLFDKGLRRKLLICIKSRLLDLWEAESRK